MPRPTTGGDAELEIRIRALGAGGYPVEMTLDGEREFTPGVLAAELTREVRRARWEPRQGVVLFEQLLHDPELRSAWDRARGDGRRLRLRLRIDEEASELQALPWEAMASAAAGSLASGAATPFSRYLACDHHHGEPVRERPLRMLVAITCPRGLEAHDLAAFDPREQRRALEDALAEARDETLLELSFLDPPVSPARLEQALREQRPHLLHLVAHGKLNPAGAALYLEADDRQVEMLCEDALAASLRRLEQPPQLVFLAACESAGGTVADAFRGLAPRLVRAGVPAVVAMQGKVPIALAGEHAATFYRQLFAHGRVDLATNEARSQLIAANHPAVAYPVLFLRARDGLLFQPGEVLAERGRQTLFLCHDGADAAAARELGSWLRGQGLRAVALGFEPANGVPAGLGWERELHARLLPCRALLLLASAQALASRFRAAEVAHARLLGKAVVVVKVEPCAIDPVLWGEREVVDLSADREMGLGELARVLGEVGIEARRPGTWTGGRPPYPGLAAFDEQDAELYFGREGEIQEGLDLLERLRRYGDRRFVVVLGASGSGKSSLLRAGLLPRWRRDPSRWLPLAPLIPSDEPFERLAGVLADAFERYGEPRACEQIHGELGRSETASGEALERLVRELRRVAKRREATVLLLVDQLEECLGHAEGERFLTLLRAVSARPGVPLWVVATLRSDLLTALEQTSAMRGFELECLRLAPMGQAALAQVIEKPAALAGLELEPGLVAELLADTETADALPLLAFTLRELWERYGGDGLLEVREYRDGLGGLEKSVERKADEVMRSLRLNEKDESVLHEAFLALVRIDEQGHLTRRTGRRAELPEAAWPWLDRFVHERLLVASGEGTERRLEVAHEALLRAWPKLAGWLEQSRAALELRRELDQAAERWVAAGQDPVYLLSKQRLRKLAAGDRCAQLRLEPSTAAFLAATKRCHRQRAILRWVLVGVPAAGLLVVGIYLLLSILATSWLMQQTALNVAFSPDGERLAAGAPWGPVRVWRTGERTSVQVLGTTDWLARNVAFSPDGKTLAAGGGLGGRVRVWDVEKDVAIAELDPPSWTVSRVVFSPDGGRLASASWFHLTLFDVAGRRTVWDHFDPEPAWPRSVAFGEDGARVLATGAKGALAHFDAVTGQELDRERLFSVDAQDVAIRPGGGLMAVVGRDQADLTAQLQSRLKIHDLASKAVLEHEDAAAWSRVAFSPDGRKLAYVADGAIAVIDLETGARVAVRGVSPTALAFKPPSGEVIATVDFGGCVKLWDMRDRALIETLEPGCEQRSKLIGFLELFE